MSSRWKESDLKQLRAGMVSEEPERQVRQQPSGSATDGVKQVILGKCPSKSNCYLISGDTLIKSKALTKYEDDFYIQCNQYRNAKIAGYFELHVDVFYPSQRADLDNAMKIILDCLQRVKAIPNDNKCVKIVAQKFLDKNNPRIEFSIIKV